MTSFSKDLFILLTIFYLFIEFIQIILEKWTMNLVYVLLEFFKDIIVISLNVNFFKFYFQELKCLWKALQFFFK